jgi:KaiC/GvpD/RAD55 family RecA-like ATPase
LDEIGEKEKREKRIKVGIAGFDQLIEGGFEEGSINIIAGESGTGKTIFSVQFINEGAKSGEPGMYISFEERKRSIFKHMAKFGIDLEKLEKDKKLFFYEYSPKEIEKFIKEGGAIEKVIRENRIKRLVIDSITSYISLYPTESERRKALIDLIDILRRWGITALLISEAETENTEVRTRFGIEYLADSLISIYSIRKGDIREMAIEIIKMRGTDHSRKIVPMRITSEGIVLYPDQPFFGKG